MFTFRVKNIVYFALLVFGGLFVATPIHATLNIADEATAQQGLVAIRAVDSQIQGESGNFNYYSVPCGANQLAGNDLALNSQMPCKFMMSSGRMGLSSYTHTSQWYELMFILTVMMVWTVLLLLIGVLWKQLKKHKSN